jgi:hypothetical protein
MTGNNAMNNEQMKTLVKDCGLEWRHGYWPLYPGDPTNRYEVLIEAVQAAERERICKWLEQGIDLGGLTEHPNWLKYTADLLNGCAAAIRAEGKA